MQEMNTSPVPVTASAKPWWQSKTILGLLPALVALVAPVFGCEISDGETKQLVDALSGVASLILVIAGRKAARGGITL